MKKILIFTYSDNLGGSEINALKIIRLSNNINFDWLVLNSSNSDLTKKIKNCNNLENYISLNCDRISSIKIFRYFYLLFNILKKGNYKSIYAVDFIPSLLVSLLKPFFAFKLLTLEEVECLGQILSYSFYIFYLFDE